MRHIIKFEEFINEEWWWSKKKEEPKQNSNSSSEPMPTPSSDPAFDEYDDDKIIHRKRYMVDSKTELYYPVVYAFITKELQERLSRKGEPVALFNQGYQILCETPEELAKYEKEYAVGKKYKGETIIITDQESESNLNH